MIGAAKSGTTTLYQYLMQHPNVFFPKHKKEPFYFSFGGQKPHYSDPEFLKHIIWETPKYLDLYKNAPKNSVLIDASTSYLYTAEKTIQNIQNMYGERAEDLKIVVILRNPIDRAFSHYNYLIRNGHETLPFETAIEPEVMADRKKRRWGYDYLEFGLYAQQIALYLKHFKHVRVYLMEDLKSPETLMQDLFSFLNLKSIPITANLVSNPSGKPKSRLLLNATKNNAVTRFLRKILPASYKNKLKQKRDMLMSKLLVKQTMNPETRKQLVEYYRQDIQNLALLIKRELSHWLK